VKARKQESSIIHRRTQKFFQGGNVNILFIIFKLLTISVPSHIVSNFLRRFSDPIRVPRFSNRVPRIRENYHRVPKIRENRVPRVREIGSLQIHTGYCCS